MISRTTHTPEAFLLEILVAGVEHEIFWYLGSLSEPDLYGDPRERATRLFGVAYSAAHEALRLHPEWRE
jgi:hypothetical protein